MAGGPSKAEEHILKEQKTSRSRWWRAGSKEAPSWFCGGELELLAPDERDRLYRKVLSNKRWVRLGLLICLLPTIVGSLFAGHHRVIGIALAVSYALGEVGSRIFRQRIFLAAARRHLQASAEGARRKPGQ